jgi:hypothetical protein
VIERKRTQFPTKRVFFCIVLGCFEVPFLEKTLVCDPKVERHCDIPMDFRKFSITAILGSQVWASVGSKVGI